VPFRIIVFSGRKGEKAPGENPPKSPFDGFSPGDRSRFRPEKTLIRHGTNQPPYSCDILFTINGYSLFLFAW